MSERAQDTAIRTPLTELLRIRHPVVQAAMGYVSGPRLAAATSNAGGPGLIASATMSLDELRAAISETAGRTDAPFGVNLRADAPDAAERIGLIIACRVPVASFAQAPKPELIAALKDAGVITIASVGARRHAEKVAAWGVDAVIATGGEGGGHIGTVPTSLLIPQVAAAVDIPVIAAGGFFDGRGLVAALAYGAAGIAMGTRFLLTSDSPVAGAVKQVYLAAGLDGTVVTRRVDGVPHRVLRTTMVDHLEGVRAGAGMRAGAGVRAGAGSGAGWLSGPRRATALIRSARNAAAFRGASGLSWRETVRQGRAMRRDAELTWPEGADGREHAGAAARGHGGRQSRSWPDVIGPGDRPDRRPAFVRGADRGDHGRGRALPGPARRGPEGLSQVRSG